MRILGCVLLHLPDESTAASTSGTCGIGGTRSAPRNESLRGLTIGLLEVSSIEALLSPFRRTATARLLRCASGTNRLPRAARAWSGIGEWATTGRRSSMPTRGLNRACEGADSPTSRHAALQPGSRTPRGARTSDVLLVTRVGAPRGRSTRRVSRGCARRNEPH